MGVHALVKLSTVRPVGQLEQFVGIPTQVAQFELHGEHEPPVPAVNKRSGTAQEVQLVELPAHVKQLMSHLVQLAPLVK